MTQATTNPTRTSTKTTWKLGEREPVATKYGGSG